MHILTTRTPPPFHKDIKKVLEDHPAPKSTATAPHTIEKVKSTAPTNPKISKNHPISKAKDVKYSTQEDSKTTHSPKNTNLTTPTNTSIGGKTKYNQSDVASLKSPAPKDDSGVKYPNSAKYHEL